MSRQYEIAACAGLAILLAACYEPTLRDCTVRCNGATECADGQVCGVDGFCAAPEVAGTCRRSHEPVAIDLPDAGIDAATLPVMPDAGAVGVDASVPDAPPPPRACDATCPGSCLGDVCLIVCTTNACTGVRCPDGMHCDIRCLGNNSCRDVDCSGACACEVTCVGNNACRDTVCPSGCEVDNACTSAGNCNRC